MLLNKVINSSCISSNFQYHHIGSQKTLAISLTHIKPPIKTILGAYFVVAKLCESQNKTL